ncbi:hypothetical protein ACHHYP_04039 [Achlya hypogyna]|uniref:Uncharacterized protein n=1 Tax=Achlya hypogyna TaxID=1202772 RepID=A0A1V9Z2I7_ACHHY|nr:hypothetical protein ACHHYP_04039 [Achlya hypogyna]
MRDSLWTRILVALGKDDDDDEVDPRGVHGRRSSLFRSFGRDKRDDDDRRFLGIFRRKSREYDDNIDGATSSTRKSLLKRWMDESNDDEPRWWRRSHRRSSLHVRPVSEKETAGTRTKVITLKEDVNPADDESTQASDESPTPSPLTSPKTTSPIKAQSFSYSYSYSYSTRPSEYAAPLRITAVPVAIPPLYRRRDRFYVGGKNIPFTRKNHVDRVAKHRWRPMDTMYEDSLYLDFALDPCMKDLVDYTRLIQPQRAMAQAFLRPSA